MAAAAPKEQKPLSYQDFVRNSAQFKKNNANIGYGPEGGADLSLLSVCHVGSAQLKSFAMCSIFLLTDTCCQSSTSSSKSAKQV